MSHIQITKQDGIAELVLNRPKVNAMNSELLNELRDAFNELAADETVKGVLLRGEGKCLSAGLDLKEVAQLTPQTLADFLALFDDAFGAAFRFPKPLSVAVTGHAIAGGLILAMCADHIAFQRGSLQHGLTELVVGVPLPPVAMEIAKHALHGRAFRTVVYGADTHSSEELFEWGVGDSLGDQAVDAARAWLSKVTSRPLSTFQFVKNADREPAFARLDKQTPEGRAALVDNMIATRNALLG